MNQSTQQLLNTLGEAGLLRDDESSVQQDKRSLHFELQLTSPWYVKIILAFSGWLAAVFLLGFVAVGFEYIIDSVIASSMMGSFMIGVAYTALRNSKNEFVEHLGLAFSLAGQALILVAMFDVFDSFYGPIWIAIAFLQCCLALLMPSSVHRVFSAYIFIISLAVYLVSVGWEGAGVLSVYTSFSMLTIAWLWLNEFRFVKHMSKLRPIGYGLILGLIQIKGVGILGVHRLDWQSWKRSSDDTLEGDVMSLLQPWMGEAIACIVMLYIAWVLLQRLGHERNDPVCIAVFTSIILLGLVSLETYGLTIGLMIVMLGFSNSNRLLLGLGVLTLLSYISFYYYLLDVSLLYKSGVLLMVGIVLLAIRWSLMRFEFITWMNNKEANND